jgi:hypothetical protein
MIKIKGKIVYCTVNGGLFNSNHMVKMYHSSTESWNALYIDLDTGDQVIWKYKTKSQLMKAIKKIALGTE